MKPEDKVFNAGQVIGKALEDQLTEVAGERMGFVLLVGPLGRGGFWPMLSNLPEKNAHAVCQQQASSMALQFKQMRRMN